MIMYITLDFGISSGDDNDNQPYYYIQMGGSCLSDKSKRYN